MSYKISREVFTDHDAFVFEFDQQSEAELLRDFPWLRQIGKFAFQHHRLSSSAGRAAGGRAAKAVTPLGNNYWKVMIVLAALAAFAVIASLLLR
jgi:hypothetical protein